MILEVAYSISKVHQYRNDGDRFVFFFNSMIEQEVRSTRFDGGWEFSSTGCPGGTGDFRAWLKPGALLFGYIRRIQMVDLGLNGTSLHHLVR